MTSAAEFSLDITFGNESASVLAGRFKSASLSASDIEKNLIIPPEMYVDPINGLISVSKMRDAQFALANSTQSLASTEAGLGAASTSKDAAAAVHESTYRRQFEINEWTAANRQETLFVYQFVFFTVCVLTILAGLYRMNIISGYFTSFASFLALFVMVMIIVYRAQYTAFKRDKRHWNRRRFDSGAGPVFAAPNCPVVMDFVTNLPQNLEGVAQGVQGAAGRGLGALGGALVGAGTALQGAAQ